MPTGLTNSPSLQSKIPTKQPAPSIPQGAINETFTVLIPASGVAMCPRYQVPTQASVNVRGQNGTADGNSAPIWIGRSPEELLNGGGRMVTPDTELYYPVDNTAQIWCRGTAGDGMQVSVTANPIS